MGVIKCALSVCLCNGNSNIALCNVYFPNCWTGLHQIKFGWITWIYAPSLMPFSIVCTVPYAHVRTCTAHWSARNKTLRWILARSSFRKLSVYRWFNARLRYSSALARELLWSCTKPSIYHSALLSWCNTASCIVLDTGIHRQNETLQNPYPNL